MTFASTFWRGMFRDRTAVAIVVCIGIGIPSVSEAVDPEALKTAFQARLEASVEEQRAFVDIPGATAAFVLPDNSFVGIATGFADRELRLPMRPETRMFAGSTGKTYAAALAMLMVAEGKMSLDDKLSRFLGDEQWYSRLPNAEEITLRHLFNHSSGVNRYVRTDEFARLVTERTTYDPDYHSPPRELIAFVLDDEPLFPAGEGYNYADTNFLLAGIAMEKVGNFRLEHEIVRRLLYPHGLVLTGPQDGIWHAGLAQGYFPEQSGYAEVFDTALEAGLYRFNPLGEWTGGGFISNSMELARWAKILFEGSAFDRPYLDDMIGLTNTYSLDQGFEYGIGAVVERNPELGLVLRHAGVYFGYGTSMAYYADYGVAIAVQVNTMYAQAARAIRTELAALVLDVCREGAENCGR